MRLDKKYIDRVICQALEEDKAHHDITTNSLIAPSANGKAEVIVKEDAVLCGLKVVCGVFCELDHDVQIRCKYRDGQKVKKNTSIIFLKGKTRALLSAERTALNFLGYLSGIATTTSRYVGEVSPYQTKVLDTRKTTPGLRILEKYAVRCGGGVNHRSDLKEMIFIKDNHQSALPAPKTIGEAVAGLRKRKRKQVIVEVDNLKQFCDILPARPDIVLLDNMSVERIREAVRAARKLKPSRRPLLEASGGITLKNIRAIAATGVDRISVGALTHSRKSIDVSMELRSL